MLQEIKRGISLEELRATLSKRPETVKEKVTSEVGIPNDLVQVQAYIRWEKAGKPSYSPETQLVSPLLQESSSLKSI